MPEWGLAGLTAVEVGLQFQQRGSIRGWRQRSPNTKCPDGVLFFNFDKHLLLIEDQYFYVKSYQLCK
jgi:hypothetical protein